MAGASHTQGYREPFSQSPAAIGYDVGTLITMGRTGRLQVVLLLVQFRVPPPLRRERKRKRETTKQGRKPPPARGLSDPRPQGDPGAHSVGLPPDRGGQAEQPTARPRSQRCKREVLLDSRECKVTVKVRQGMTAGPTSGAQTYALSTDRMLHFQPGVGGTGWATHGRIT